MQEREMPDTRLTAAALMALSFSISAPAQDSALLNEVGEVTDGDTRDSDSYPYDEYVLTLPALTRVQVTATRVDPFDPNVEILGINGQRIVYDDDSAGELNARARFSTTDPGQYRIRVRGLGGSTGGYRVMAENLGPATPPPAPRAIRGDQSGRLTAATSPATDQGSYYADYRIRLNAGQEVVLNLDSADFDAYLNIYDEDDVTTALASADDSNGTRNAVMVFRAPASGTYIVRATQLGISEGGYRLRVRRLTAW
jgi:hypothetical protein